ncbi:MAG: hypothetical protein KDH09_15735, partial [Chrysiogenetes bacterium]|nr:hypothetical protein [Chrysiogenetes bacterium]
MADIVFFLGAGASCEAKAPLMNEFLHRAEDIRDKLSNHNGLQPRDEADLNHFNCVMELLAELDREQAKIAIQPNNLESFFSALEMARILGPGIRFDLDRIQNAY